MTLVRLQSECILQGPLDSKEIGVLASQGSRGVAAALKPLSVPSQSWTAPRSDAVRLARGVRWQTRPSEGCGLGDPGLPASVAWLNSGPPSTSRSVGLSDGAAGGCWRHLGRPGLHSNCQNYAAGVDHALDGTGLDVSSLVAQYLALATDHPQSKCLTSFEQHKQALADFTS